jgi:hypothetical protein
MGRLVNFVRNNSFKHTGEPTSLDSQITASSPSNTSFTREARLITIAEKTEPSKDKIKEEIDKEIIRLVMGEAKILREKEVKYENYNVIEEILMARLYRLTGFMAPKTVFVVKEDNAKTRKVPKLSIASPLISGFYDLGNFLTNRAATRFIGDGNLAHWEELSEKLKEVKKELEEDELDGDRREELELKKARLEWKTRDLTIWNDAKKEIEEIDQEGRITGQITDKHKLRKIELMGKIYELLPDYFHREIEKAFAASKFIHNWDFANLSLCNIGLQFDLDDAGNVIAFRSIFVDFGNSGVIGFKGKHKEQSFAQANSEAKKQDKSPNDFDPSLILTDEENQFLENQFLDERVRKILVEESEEERKGMTEEEIEKERRKREIKAKAKALEFTDEEVSLLKEGAKALELTDEEVLLLKEEEEKAANPEKETKIELSDREKKILRTATLKKSTTLKKSIIFKTAHHIMEEETSMEVGWTTGLLTFSDLPRNLPFGILFKKRLQEKTETVLEDQFMLARGKTAESSTLPSPTPLDSILHCDSEIEVAFRLSLISDQAIDTIFSIWNLREQYPSLFPPLEEVDDPDKYRGERFTQIFKDRRDALVNSVPREVINEWLTRNRPAAIAAEQSIRMAILEECGTECPINENNSFNERLKSFTADQLRAISTNDQAIKAKNIFISKIRRQIEKQQSQEALIPGPDGAEEVKSDQQNAKKIEELNIKIENAKLSIKMLSDADMPEQSKQFITESLKAGLLALEESLKQLEPVEQRVVKFIEENLPKWKKLIGLEPSCDLLNLERIKKEFELRNGPIPEPSDDVDKQQKRKVKIRKQICFIIDKFTETLEQLSPPELSPLITQLPPLIADKISKMPATVIEADLIEKLTDQRTNYSAAIIA